MYSSTISHDFVLDRIFPLCAIQDINHHSPTIDNNAWVHVQGNHEIHDSDNYWDEVRRVLQSGVYLCSWWYRRESVVSSLWIWTCRISQRAPDVSWDTTQLASVKKTDKILIRLWYHGIVSWPLTYHLPEKWKLYPFVCQICGNPDMHFLATLK